MDCIKVQKINRKRRSLSCVHPSTKREIMQFRFVAVMQVLTESCFFDQFFFAFCRSRCCRHRRCLRWLDRIFQGQYLQV